MTNTKNENKKNTVMEIISVKQLVSERPVEYETGITSSIYAKQLGMKEIGDEAQEVLLLVVLNTKNKINAIHRVFVGRIKNNTKEIANLVANASPSTKYALVNTHSNKLILTTIGCFLDNVINQEWLKEELLPTLIPLQTGENEVKEVIFYEF